MIRVNGYLPAGMEHHILYRQVSSMPLLEVPRTGRGFLAGLAGEGPMWGARRVYTTNSV